MKTEIGPFIYDFYQVKFAKILNVQLHSKAVPLCSRGLVCGPCSTEQTTPQHASEQLRDDT